MQFDAINNAQMGILGPAAMQRTERGPHKLSDGFCVKRVENGGWIVSHYDRQLGAFTDFPAFLAWLESSTI